MQPRASQPCPDGPTYHTLAKRSAAGLLLAVLLGAVGCRNQPTPSQNAAVTTALTSAALTTTAAPRCGDTARKWVTEGATLVDVRTPEEFSAGHLAGALNLPVDELGTRMSELPEGKVVVYCQSGRRAELAQAQLEKAERDVYLLGGIKDWDSKDCSP